MKDRPKDSMVWCLYELHLKRECKQEPYKLDRHKAWSKESERAISSYCSVWGPYKRFLGCSPWLHSNIFRLATLWIILYVGYLISLSVESVLKSNHIRMKEFLHYLELSILIALILVNFFDCNNFTCLSDSCLTEAVLIFRRSLPRTLHRKNHFLQLCLHCMWSLSIRLSNY